MENRTDLRILIMTSVEAEKLALLRGLEGDSRFAVCIAGVGAVAAAIHTTRAIADGEYDMIINAGIAGGFVGQADIGSLVIASDIIAADLGAESPGGFLSIDELGFGSARVAVATEQARNLAERCAASGIRVKLAPILTCSTATGTQQTAERLAATYAGAAAEAMEGFGVASAAALHRIPVLEVRAISNAVGPRNRDAWRIPDALQTLEAVAKIMKEVLSWK